MDNSKLKTAALVALLVSSMLVLGGCRKNDTSVTPTPAVQKLPSKQLLPNIGDSSSPLPTPSAATSPIKK